MRHARVQKARKTGGCQRRSPRAFSTGANSPGKGENTTARGPSQQPSPRRTDATSSRCHQSGRRGVLAAAFTKKNRCHSKALRLNRALLDFSQQPSPRRTDATEKTATRWPHPSAPRSSRYQEEPMPRSPTRDLCGLPRVARSSRYQEEPMPLQADRHRPAAAVLAAADTRKNRCHARLYPNGTPPLGSRSSRYQEEPMPRTLSRSLGDRVHARSSRYQEEPMPPVTGRLSPRGNQALSQQPIPGRTDATPAPTLPTRSARPLAAADTRKNRCHCCTDYPILCRPDSQQPIPARTDATAHVGRYDALRATSQQPAPVEPMPLCCSQACFCLKMDSPGTATRRGW